MYIYREIFHCKVESGKVSLRNAHGKYLSCSNEHKPWSADHEQDWEFFTIMIMVGESAVVAHDYYRNLSESQQRLVEEEQAAKEAEQKRLTEESSVIATEKANHIASLKEEVAKNSQAEITLFEAEEATRRIEFENSEATKFQSESFFFKGQIVLKSDHGTYITIENDGTVRAKGTMYDWSRSLIEIEPKGNSQYLFKASCNQKYAALIIFIFLMNNLFFISLFDLDICKLTKNRNLCLLWVVTKSYVSSTAAHQQLMIFLQLNSSEIKSP